MSGTAGDRTALPADFSNTFESFNRVMGFCGMTLGEIFQEEFNAGRTRGAKQQFASIPLVEFRHYCHTATSISQEKTIIGAFAEQTIARPRLARYHQRLNRAAKDLMLILVSIILSDNPAGRFFVNSQLNPINLHKRMEETRTMLMNHYAVEGGLLIKQWVKNIEIAGNVPPTTGGKYRDSRECPADYARLWPRRRSLRSHRT